MLLGRGQRRRDRQRSVERTQQKAALVPERLGDLGGRDHAAERQIATGDALGEGDQVRRDTETLDPEPATQPAVAADHLVRDEKYAVLASDRGGRLQISWRRRDNA